MEGGEWGDLAGLGHLLRLGGLGDVANLTNLSWGRE